MVIKYSIKTAKNSIFFCVDAENVVWRASPKFPWLENMKLDTVVEMCRKKGWTLVDEFSSPH
jgi:hypothetical protein